MDSYIWTESLIRKIWLNFIAPKRIFSKIISFQKVDKRRHNMKIIHLYDNVHHMEINKYRSKVSMNVKSLRIHYYPTFIDKIFDEKIQLSNYRKVKITGVNVLNFHLKLINLLMLCRNICKHRQCKCRLSLILCK